MHKENAQLLQILSECAAECNHCSTACLNEQDVKMLSRCIRLDMDCADVCHLTATFVARGSANAQSMIDMCIELCEACAEECEKHSKMEHCKRCADACRRCADECRKGFKGSMAA